MLRQSALALVSLAAAFSLARADVRGHCEAYATDFAAAYAAAGEVRQHKYDIALAGCLADYDGASVASGPRPAATKGAPAPGAATARPAAATVKPAARASASENSNPAPARPAATGPAVQNGLTVGSAEWKAYCAAKYTSFNPARGTYTSMTGKERPCLVTRSRIY